MVQHPSKGIPNVAYLANVELVERLKLGRGISSSPRWMEIVSGSSKAPASTSDIYSGVWRDAFVGFLYNFNINEEHTTDTELRAIAAEAIQGYKLIQFCNGIGNSYEEFCVLPPE